MANEIDASKSYWFVGASYGKDSVDQTNRFLSEGIWQNGYRDKYLDIVRTMKIGDRIAIKSAYVRKKNLPFNNNNHSVAVMRIKAIGVITNNHGDGRFVDVDWEERIEPPKEWYLNSYQATVHRIVPRTWMREALIAFTFNGHSQDIDRFRNDPYWKERFGDAPTDTPNFQWCKFYESFADGLMTYRYNRKKLSAFVAQLGDRLRLAYITSYDKQHDDIDPFTVMGMFNHGIKDASRSSIAKELANFLGVDEPVPDTFDGIPLLHHNNPWFVGYGENRTPSVDTESLWDFMGKALRFADSDDLDVGDFCDAYDKVAGQYAIGWKQTMGLYWIRPWHFVTLDGPSQDYITQKLGIDIEKNGPKRGYSSALDYLKVRDTLELRFQEEDCPVRSFPDLSYTAYMDALAATKKNKTNKISEAENEAEVSAPTGEPYGIEDIIADGAFIDSDTLIDVIKRLRNKKNIILQGPPGTGKTWLAKRLAFALIGQKLDNKIRHVQFHPNLTYEDFVRGWRPSGDGKLTLVDGPFLEMIDKAKKDKQTDYVAVIEEINRGNPAQIFGEMLTLLEADKRTPNEAMELSYRRSDDERVYIPDNLYVIGTMNIADRSLALVDLALRRRFAYINLQPTFGKPWRDWVHDKFKIDMNVLKTIEQRVLQLNETIANDKSLGAQFRIGHSYVTPAFSDKIDDDVKWYKRVVETEIGPLLADYWFDNSEKVEKAKAALIADM